MLEDKIRYALGDLVFQNLILQQQKEELVKALAEAQQPAEDKVNDSGAAE